MAGAVFVTGGTGYIRRPLIEALVAAVETPPARGARIVDVPAIAQASLRP